MNGLSYGDAEAFHPYANPAPSNVNSNQRCIGHFLRTHHNYNLIDSKNEKRKQDKTLPVFFVFTKLLQWYDKNGDYTSR
ncbi:MAG: hypothetical protein EOP48_11775 [Sphingobacteriales bacterium]|nr:MAG: hypothetical protein EOP48_11775 [Sphingobacteriales bacterium]